MKLNQEQQAVVNHVEGPALIISVPGSGKTRCITERTANLIKLGKTPESILCVTFTNKAADEMRERIKQTVGEELASRVFISNFHKMCVYILKNYGYEIGYKKWISIIDEDEQVARIQQILRKKEIEVGKPICKTISAIINNCRENIESDEQISDKLYNLDEQFENTGKEYIEKIRELNQFDFSSLMSETYRLLVEKPHVLEKIQKTWKYFQNDECQDSNKVQFEIMKLLSKHTKNLVYIGDIFQCIYGWRGARSANIDEFIEEYKPTIYNLPKNYRSTPEILEKAEKLIKHSKSQFVKDYNIVTDNPSGSPVMCKSFNDDKEEANWIAATLKSAVDQNKIQPKNIAVLYRTNSQSRAIEMAMVSYSLPYTIIGGYSFYDRKEIKDCLAMLKFLLNKDDGIAFHRFANKPKRNLGDAAIGKIEKFAHDNKIDIIEAMKTISVKSEMVQKGMKTLLNALDYDYSSFGLGEILERLTKELDYKKFLENEDPDTAQERWWNVEELIKDATRFNSEQSSNIDDYLEQIALVSTTDKETDGNSISLLTIHAAKGLEYDAVFLIGMEKDILPHKNAMAEADGIEEERKLAFVGMTRAKKKLICTYCNKRQETGGKFKFRKVYPSQFLYESGLLVKKPDLYEIGN